MEDVITNNEQEIREKFGFRKNRDKFPLVYKSKRDDGSIETTLVEKVELIQLDSDGAIGSLRISLPDGETKRITSAYLVEMQLDKFTFDVKGDIEA